MPSNEVPERVRLLREQLRRQGRRDTILIVVGALVAIGLGLLIGYLTS